jgi:hypothetical protein
MSERIRWEPASDGGWDGKVGTLEPWVFGIWESKGAGWALETQLPGAIPAPGAIYRDSPDELKAEAERLLERFVSSLGAVFDPATAEPDCSAVTRFEVIDLAGGLASRSPDSVRAVVAYGISAKLAFQDDGRTLKVFLTDPAKEADR